MPKPADIVKRFRRSNVTMRELRDEYRCGYEPLSRLLRQHIGDAEWRILMRIRVGRKRKCGDELCRLLKMAADGRKQDVRDGNQLERQRRRAARERRALERESNAERRDREMFETAIKRLASRIVCRWECIGCGFEFANEPTGICPKCNGLRFEKIVQRCVP